MGLFDFNRDGKSDSFELFMGLSFLGSLCEEEHDEEYEEEESEEIEERLGLLQDELSDLEDELLTVEVNEPDDILSEAYARWEQRRDLLEEQIACVEEQIDDLEW